MNGIEAFLAAKGAALLGGVGVGLAVTLGLKIILKKWNKFLGEQLSMLTSLEKINDPQERELVKNIVLAVVRWAEYKIPDKGRGRERYGLAASQLVKFFPILKKQESKLAELIEEAVVKMDEALKNVVK